MATFGYENTTTTTTVGPSSASKTAVSQATPATSGVVQTGHARFTTSAAGKDVEFVIYSNVVVGTEDRPGDLLAKSDIVSNLPAATHTQQFTFSGDQQIAVEGGTKYWIGYTWNNEGGSFTGYRSPSNTAPRWEHEDVVWPDPWDPFEAGGVDGNARPLSGPLVAHVTYSEGPPPEKYKFYLSNVPANHPVTSSANYWVDDSAAENPRQLSLTPAGAAADRQVAETTDTPGYLACLGQWVSDPFEVPGTLYADWRSCIGIYEDDSSSNMFQVTGVWVTVGDTDARRGDDFIISFVDTSAAAELPTAAEASLQSAGKGNGLGQVDFQAGDRLVVEFGFQANNTTVDGEATIHFGGTSTPDLADGDTNLSRPAWIELTLSPGVTFEEPAAVVTTRFFLSY